MYNIATQEEVAVHMRCFDGIRRGNYFRGEGIGRAEVEVRVGKFKNGKTTDKDEITGKMIKGGGDRVEDCIWRLCNMASESGVVPEDSRSDGIVPLYKGKGERTECKNYAKCGWKIYAGVLVDRALRVTGGLIDDEQGALQQGVGV